MAGLRRHFPVMALASAALSAAVPVSAGDPASGQAIARQWCSECHVVADDQAAASVDVPTFRSIAAVEGFDAGALAGFLADPHPVMPQMTLSRAEIDDLVAYIASLRLADAD